MTTIADLRALQCAVDEVEAYAKEAERQRHRQKKLLGEQEHLKWCLELAGIDTYVMADDDAIALIERYQVRSDEEPYAWLVRVGADGTWIEKPYAPSTDDALRALLRAMDEADRLFVEKHAPSFTTEQIILAVQGGLRAQAIAEVIIAAPIRCTITSADDLRWNAELSAGQVRLIGEWVTLLPIAIAALARTEHLDWRRDDGRVLRWDDTTGGAS